MSDTLVARTRAALVQIVADAGGPTFHRASFDALAERVAAAITETRTAARQLSNLGGSRFIALVEDAAVRAFSAPSRKGKT